jgi:hypothetical protein
MVRFKDVTKVVLALVLCFGFAGVCGATVLRDGITQDLLDDEKAKERAKRDCKEARETHKNHYMALWCNEGKEKDFQKLADANKSYSISAREANNRDYEENKKKAIEAERVAVDKCTFSLRIEMDEEAKREYYRGLCKKKFGINRDL